MNPSLRAHDYFHRPFTDLGALQDLPIPSICLTELYKKPGFLHATFQRSHRIMSTQYRS